MMKDNIPTSTSSNISFYRRPEIVYFYYTSVYIFYIKLNADKITILHIKIQLLILFK
jgi:hypothetical protein